MGKVRDFNNIPSWSATLGALRQASATVRAICPRCAGFKADLERMIEAKGETYSLWNRTTPCPRPGCDGHVWFKASLGSGWPTNMRNAHPAEAEGLHRAHMEGFDYEAWKRQGGDGFDF
jgi:hypothetical protein